MFFSLSRSFSHFFLLILHFKEYMYAIDIKEDYLLGLGNGILEKLLLDRTTGENIIWATDDYASMGDAYKYSDFIKQGNDVCYNGRKVMIDEVLDYSFEEIPTKAELDENPNLFYAGIVYEDQSTETISITKLVPLRHVTELTKNELIKLKKQIHPGGFFLGDYENTLGIDRKELSDVSKNALICNVKRENTRHFINGTAKTKYINIVVWQDN